MTSTLFNRLRFALGCAVIAAPLVLMTSTAHAGERSHPAQASRHRPELGLAKKGQRHDAVSTIKRHHAEEMRLHHHRMRALQKKHSRKSAVAIERQMAKEKLRHRLAMQRMSTRYQFATAHSRLGLPQHGHHKNGRLSSHKGPRLNNAGHHQGKRGPAPRVDGRRGYGR